MSPPKYCRTPHWPWSKQIHSDDKTHQDPSFFVGKQVIITEKLDGGNTALCNGQTYARSTGQPATQGWFAHVKKYHAWKTAGYPNSVFYGEDIAARHSIDYTVSINETYKVFAIREGDEFLPWYDVVVICSYLDLEVVPLLFRGVFDSTQEITKWFETEINKPSKFGSSREGFVMLTSNGFMADEFGMNVCKYVRKDHVQTDAHWTHNWSWNTLLK